MFELNQLDSYYSEPYAYDLIWLVGLLPIYYFFGHQLLLKNYICLFAFLMSSYVTFNNWEHYMEDPEEGTVGCYVVNSFMRTYLTIDLMLMMSRWWQTGQIRTELMFHHILCIIPFHHMRTTFSMTFVTMAEILSIGPILFTNVKYKMYLRVIAILFRTWIWTHLFTTHSYLRDIYDVLSAAKFWCTVVPIVMYYLDYIWLTKALQIIRKNHKIAY